MPEGHPGRVSDVKSQVISRPSGVTCTIRKLTRRHTIFSVDYKRSAHPVDVSRLTHVGDVLRPRGREDGQVTVWAEGQVTLEKLVAHILPSGWLPGCVPEYPDFTVAGLVNGGGIQSSSHLHGLFFDSVQALEVVLGDGRLVYCTRHPDPDVPMESNGEDRNGDDRVAGDERVGAPGSHAELFHSLSGAFGTLGIVTAVKLALVPAARYVRSRYRWFDDAGSFAAELARRAGNKEVPYMDAVAYAPDKLCIIETSFVRSQDEPTEHDGAPVGVPIIHPGPREENIGNPWYYQHVRATRERPDDYADATRTEEYLFRSCRGTWWLAEMIINSPLLANLTCVRRSADRDEYDSRMSGSQRAKNPLGLEVDERERCMVLQDVGVNITRIEEGLSWIRANIGIWPIWCCVYRVPPPVGWAAPAHEGVEWACDLGIYGEPTVQPYRRIRTMRALQQFVDYPSLWGVCYLTREEIRKIVDVDKYDAIRARYKANGAFQHITDKILWVDPNGADPGPVPGWRWLRAWRDSRSKCLCAASIVALYYLVVVALLALSAWVILEVSGGMNYIGL